MKPMHDEIIYFSTRRVEFPVKRSSFMATVNHGGFYYEMILNSMFIPKIRRLTTSYLLIIKV